MERQDKKKYEEYEALIRILSTDIPENISVYAGLTRIKGISWSFSNSICHALKIDKKKKIKELSKEETDKISKFIKEPNLPEFILNRRKDLETGINRHLI